MTVADSVLRLVRERAGNRCEYCLCHQDYVMGIEMKAIEDVIMQGKMWAYSDEPCMKSKTAEGFG